MAILLVKLDRSNDGLTSSLSSIMVEVAAVFLAVVQAADAAPHDALNAVS